MENRLNVILNVIHLVLFISFLVGIYIGVVYAIKKGKLLYEQVVKPILEKVGDLEDKIEKEIEKKGKY